MEYLTYILIILGILAVCLLVFRVSGEEQPRTRAGVPAGTRKDLETPETAGPLLPGNRLKVPTPWGWPGYDEAAGKAHLNAQEVRGVSESLHKMVDRLLSEKQTVDSAEYLLRKNASLRALVEDRYGRSGSVRFTDPQKTQKTPVAEGFSRSMEQRSLEDVRTPWGW